jgi:glycosyltransferase involved in cell wall biosynthesis
MKLNPDIKVSAVICCYHGVKSVYNALCSLQKQSLEKKLYEVIVIDNGSIDGSSFEIERFFNDFNSLNFNVFKISNEGLSNERNFGYNKAKGDFIFYMDDDAYADEMCLEFIFKSFMSNTNTNVLGGTVGILNDKNKFANLYHNSIFRHWMEDIGIIIGTNMSFRKSLLSKSEGFIKDLKYRGDESAFFEKNKKNIVSQIDKSVLVYHTQPERLKSFLKSRYENGEAKAFLTLTFNNNNIIDKIKNLYMFLIRFFSSGIGFLIASFLCLYLKLNFFNILILGILFTIRFLFHHDLRGSLIVYSKTEYKSYNVLNYFYITFIVTIGSLLEDLGYVLSFLKLTLKKINNYEN